MATSCAYEKEGHLYIHLQIRNQKYFPESLAEEPPGLPAPSHARPTTEQQSYLIVTVTSIILSVVIVPRTWWRMAVNVKILGEDLYKSKKWRENTSNIT